MRVLHNLAFLLLFVSFCSAAYVYGDMYTHDLEKLNETTIRIEGRFSYQLVTEKANYSIFLPEGEYTISASSFDEDGNLALYAEERIKVGEQNQQMDLVLQPVNEYDNTLLYAGLLLLIVIIFLWTNSKFHPKKVPEPEKKKMPVRKKIELDEDAKKVLQVLDSFEKRATQKELRTALNFSDTKLSLILTELEHLGHIKKFKRGRANIVKRLD